MGTRKLSVTFLAVGSMLLGAAGAAETIDVADLDQAFAYHYDYVLTETAGLERSFEPVEVTLTTPGDPPPEWQDHIRVLRVVGENRGVFVPHEVLGTVSAVVGEEGDSSAPAPTSSINVVFLAQCPAHGEVTYRLFWGLPREGAAANVSLPVVDADSKLEIEGELPGLQIRNEFYTIQLDPKSGAIQTALAAGQSEDSTMFYKGVPIHFGTDAWSPGKGWDHDYDWVQPPNQKQEGGPLALRYHRWGPLQNYRDVVVSITYTFYAHVPYVHVSSTMEFTADRSVRAVRIGEIVVSHSKKPGAADDAGKSPDLFTHYAWPELDGATATCDIDANRDQEGRANLEGVVPGALAILDRDVPWVAGYHAGNGFGLASLRNGQFAGNRKGRPTPHSAPCTYVANYGWGFTYWSRPMVYPLGEKATPLDINTAVAAGTLFATDEALLFFKPDDGLTEVREAHTRFTQPLRFRFKGTGPW